MLATRRHLNLAKIKKPLSRKLPAAGKTRFLTRHSQTSCVVELKAPLRKYFAKVFAARPRGPAATPTKERNIIENATPADKDHESFEELDDFLLKMNRAIGLLQTKGIVNASLRIPLFRTFAYDVAKVVPGDSVTVRASKAILEAETKAALEVSYAISEDGTPTHEMQALYLDRTLNTWDYVPSGIHDVINKAMITVVEREICARIAREEAAAGAAAVAPPPPPPPPPPPSGDDGESAAGSGARVKATETEEMKRAQLLSMLTAGSIRALAPPPSLLARTPRNQATQQVNDFRKRSKFPVATELDSLSWIAENKELFPDLAAVAIRRLGKPATSIGCERFFSVAGDILSPKRSLLSGRHLEMLAVLKASEKTVKELVEILS